LGQLLVVPLDVGRHSDEHCDCDGDCDGDLWLRLGPRMRLRLATAACDRGCDCDSWDGGKRPETAARWLTRLDDRTTGEDGSDAAIWNRGGSPARCLRCGRRLAFVGYRAVL
jgi:hypothetical protein